MEFDKMKEIIKNDPETKDLDITDADVLQLYQYIEMRNNKTVIDGYIPQLKTEPYIEITYMPTKKRQTEILREKMRRHMDYFDSDIFLQDVRLADFDVFNDERKRALDLSYEFLKHYRKDNFHKGLYIYGRYASGKTYLLSAIAQELAKRDVNVLFVFMPDLVRSIKNGMTQGDLEERVNRLKQADVLMIDDIGGENITSWFRDEILLPTIQYRLSAKLPIFLSSNLELKDLAQALAVGRQEHDMTKSIRIIQRIKDLTTYVRLSDERYKKMSISLDNVPLK